MSLIGLLIVSANHTSYTEIALVFAGASAVANARLGWPISHLLRNEEAVMSRDFSFMSASALFVCLTALSSPSWALHPSDGYAWGDAPPVLKKGAKMAVLQGDPGKAEPYTIRLSLPAGYRIAPHSHTQTENVTVISGTLLVGMGDTFDTKAMNTFKPGGFGSILGGVHHFAMSKGSTEVQIHGVGPFDLIYVNPADDPQKNASGK